MTPYQIIDLIEAATRGPARTDKCYYVAGPMRGYEQWNFPAFDAARDLLVNEGHLVISPADLDRMRGFNEAEETEFSQEQFDLAMQVDLTAIAAFATDMYLIKGWVGSIGVGHELAVARACGKNVRYGIEFDAEIPFSTVGAVA